MVLYFVKAREMSAVIQLENICNLFLGSCLSTLRLMQPGAHNAWCPSANLYPADVLF